MGGPRSDIRSRLMFREPHQGPSRRGCNSCLALWDRNKHRRPFWMQRQCRRKADDEHPTGDVAIPVETFALVLGWLVLVFFAAVAIALFAK